MQYHAETSLIVKQCVLHLVSCLSGPVYFALFAADMRECQLLVYLLLATHLVSQLYVIYCVYCVVYGRVPVAGLSAVCPTPGECLVYCVIARSGCVFLECVDVTAY